MSSCTNIAGLVKAEITWITGSKEFQAYKRYLERVEQDSLSTKDAMNQYMHSDHFPYHAQRMRHYYCNTVCEVRDACTVCDASYPGYGYE